MPSTIVWQGYVHVRGESQILAKSFKNWLQENLENDLEKMTVISSQEQSEQKVEESGEYTQSMSEDEAIDVD